MVEKIFFKKMIIFIFIFFIINVSYSVKAMPMYTNDGSWVTIYKDPMDSSKLKTDYDANTYSDLITLINHLISKGKYNIYIKDGDYDLNGTLMINNENIVIVGQSKENTKIKETINNQNSIKVNADNFKMANCYIENTIGYVVFHAQHVDGVQLTNCIIKGSDVSPAVAIFGADVTMNSNSKIQGNTIYSGSGLPSSFGQALIFLNQKNGEVSGNNIFGGSMDLEVCYDLIVDNNDIENSLKGGIKVLLPGENIKILNNTTKNTYNSGISVVASSSDNNRYSGIEVKNNNITKTEYFGIEINNLDTGIIEDNIISEIDFYGIYILKSDNLNIENNQILNCELYNGSAPRWISSIKASLYLEVQVQNSKIKNNLIHNDINNPSQYGIRIQSGSQNINNTIFNNIIDGSFTTLISANSSGSESTNVIRVVKITKDAIAIEWEEVDAIAEYQLEVDGNPILVDVGVNENYESTGLDSNSTHKYRIRIKGGQWSGIITLKTLTSPTPVVIIPQNIKATTTGSSIKISWDEVDATTEYEVEVDGSLIIVDVGGNEVYEHKGLLSSETHNYRVRIKGEQWSGFITAVTLVSQSPIDIIPQNIKATTTGSSIRISWDEVEDTTEYEIEVDGKLILVGTKEHYDHTGLKSDYTHNYRVRIKGGEWSKVLIATTTKLLPIEIPENPIKSHSSKHKSSKVISNEYDEVEMNFGSKIILIYQKKLIQNSEEDKLKRVILYTVEEKSYVRIKAWKNNEVKINKEYELYQTPGLIFAIDEIKKIAVDRNDKIETILVKDIDGYINLMNIAEDSSLSKYSIENGYIVSINNLGMKVQNNQKCTKL